MVAANTLQFQEILINRTQQLLDQCLETGAYNEAIALGELLKNLGGAYRDFVGKDGVVGAGATQPVIQIQRKPSSNGAFGNGAFTNGNRAIPVRPEPPKPTQYQWADGFNGVTLPPPLEQQQDDGDYWQQDTRRQ
jgi:hypothetical protein